MTKLMLDLVSVFVLMAGIMTRFRDDQNWTGGFPLFESMVVVVGLTWAICRVAIL